MDFIRYENNRKYILTKHLRQRYCERVLNRSYDGRLTKEDGDNFIRCKYLSIRKDYDNILWFLNGNVQLLRKFYENHIRK